MNPDFLKITYENNMDLMSRYNDNYFDYAIVDIEYNIGASSPSVKPEFVKQKNGNLLHVKSNNYVSKKWDFKKSDEKYFKELFRVSRNQIIFGGNYYGLSGGYLVWDKLNGESDQFGCELAWLSFTKRTDIVYYMWSGMFQGSYCGRNITKALVQKGNKSQNEERIHPTQKPVALYLWIIREYLKSGNKILDTHLGSGTIAKAVSILNGSENMNLELVACENDSDYFNNMQKSLDNFFTVQDIFKTKNNNKCTE